MPPLPTLLYAAIEEGDVLALKELLERGASPLAPAGGHTPLMHAARFGQDDCIAILLPLSNTLAADRYGRTALMHACAAHGDASCAQALLHASDLRAVD